jgi:integrase
VSLYKRGGVYWSYLYRDGVREQFSTGTGNRKEAQKIEDERKQEINNEKFQIVEYDPDITVGAIAAKFVVSGSAHRHHHYHLRFLLGLFSDTPALRVTKALAEEFRRKRKKFNPMIKDATINRDLSVLRHVLYWAVDEKLIATNPLARLKMPPERRIRRQILSVAEETSLLGVAKGHLRAMIVIALDAGMRRGEITSQRWEDIDFSQRIISVTHSKTPGGELREIPLTDRLCALLVERRRPNGIVIEFAGQPVRIVKTAWRTALKNAKIRHMRFHDLRHTFATRLMEAGVLQEVRMALMGHSPGAKIHAVYTHIELPTKREAIRKLEAWVNQQCNQQKEHEHANSEIIGSESNPGPQAGTQTVEEEDTRRGGLGTSRQAEIRDRRDGGAAEGETAPAPEVRGGPKAVRGRVDNSGKAKKLFTDGVPAPDL